jgi:hypothetical protein
MKIATFHSHLNGYEFLLVHKESLWAEIEGVIEKVDASACDEQVVGYERVFAELNLHRNPVLDEIHLVVRTQSLKSSSFKHLAFYVGDVIDVGIEILPMKKLQQEMSSGVGHYEGELYNLVREGRGVPAVPLVLIGIVP